MPAKIAEYAVRMLFPLKGKGMRAVLFASNVYCVSRGPY